MSVCGPGPWAKMTCNIVWVVHSYLDTRRIYRFVDIEMLSQVSGVIESSLEPDRCKVSKQTQKKKTKKLTTDLHISRSKKTGKSAAEKSRSRGTCACQQSTRRLSFWWGKNSKKKKNNRIERRFRHVSSSIWVFKYYSTSVRTTGWQSISITFELADDVVRVSKLLFMLNILT